jgi:predicted ribosomally synthesized peptide with SipW-like signal peptide
VGTGVAEIAALALTAGTYAAFTDSTVGPGGTIRSGNLDLDLATNPRNTATVLDESGLYPGRVLAGTVRSTTVARSTAFSPSTPSSTPTVGSSRTSSLPR